LKTIDLFSGIAIVIDDEIGDKEANINNLISQIEKHNMPYLMYKKLPNPSITEHFNGISFLLLDWQLQPKTLSKSAIKGVTTPTSVSDFTIKENINFLKKIRESCFTPIFIFTNEDEETVKKTLIENNLCQVDKPNYIFVKSKKDLIGTKKLFNTINDWITKAPSVYVLKTWEKEYKKSKNELFYDFYKMSPNWPIVLWKSFAVDCANMSLELGEVITRNLYSRMMPFAFDNKILSKYGKKAPRDEVRKVLQGERFITNKGLHKDTIAAGDIFENPGNKTYINIRPDCDCILGRDTINENTDDVDLYLLEGYKLTTKQEKGKYREKYGNFEEIDNESIAFSIIDGKTFKFGFKNLTIKNWASIKDKRIGRLLPPYITRMQQRYALYLQRQGLLRIPDIAVLGK
jgi:hypothetical protein